jgi:hypothetical protein
MLRRSRSFRALPIALLLLAACLPYLNSLPNAFHFDDSQEIVENEQIRSFDGLRAARPLARWLLYASFYLNYRVHGLSFMPGWHAVDIILHGACVLALYYTLRGLLTEEGAKQATAVFERRLPAAFLGALLFAVHPLASEPVNYIQARCVLMYTLFSLLALHAAICFRHAASPGRKVGHGAALVAWVLLASLSKQVGLFYSLALPALYFLICVLPGSTHKRRLALWAAGAAAALVFVAGVWVVETGDWIPMRERLQGDLWYYFWGQTIVFWRYVALSLCPLPSNLNFDHAVPCRAYSPTDADVLLSVIATALVVVAPAIYLVRRRPVAGFLLLAVPVGLLPYFVMTSAEAMVEYRFYLPLAACCGLAGMVAAFVLERAKTVGPIVLATLVVALSIGTVVRNCVWRTDLTLWSDAALKSPRKARTLNALAWALLTDKVRGDPRRALELAERSFDPRCVDLWPGLNPYMVDTLAEAYFVNGDVDKAIRVEQTLISQGVGDLDYFRRQLDRYTAAQREMALPQATPPPR